MAHAEEEVVSKLKRKIAIGIAEMYRVEDYWREQLVVIKKAAQHTDRLMLLYIKSERKLKDTYNFVYS
jgi:hypothetical protein